MRTFKNIHGATLSDIGGGTIKFTKGGPLVRFILRLRETPAPTDITNSTFKITMVIDKEDHKRDGELVGWVNLSREGLAELIAAYTRQDESTHIAPRQPIVDLGALAK